MRARGSSLIGGAGVLALVAGLGVGLPTGSAAAVSDTAPFISEIHYDNDGADTGEFVEVQLPAGTSSSGLSVVLYNGAPTGSTAGKTYATLTLPSVTAPADSAAVVAVAGPLAGIQNGDPDGLALVGPGQTVLEFLSYDGAFTAADGPAAGRPSVDIGVGEASNAPAGTSLSKRRIAAGDYLWQASAPNTRGAVNPPLDSGPPPGSGQCDLPTTHQIGEVQGSGANTPLEGQQVTVRGVVVGDLPGLSGFYLQDPDGDGSSATSDGIFVFSTVPVGLGDTVELTGGATDRFGQTQVTSSQDVEVCTPGSAADLPAATTLDLPADDAAREPFEGMLVAPADTLTVSEVFALTRFGELTLAEGGLLVQPTELARPGSPEAKQIAAENARRRILLDDGSDASRSATNRPYLSATTPVRVGDALDFTEPLVLGYGFGKWRLQPADGTADGVFAPQNSRPAAPDEVGGDVQVGAFNVLNYFLTLAPAGGRGAETAAEFGKQSTKIVTAIGALDVDVVTLMEIEDTDSTGYSPGNADSALADLVGKLNAAAGADRWAYVPLPQELYGVDRDVIRSAIIYRKDVVQPVGAPVGLVDEAVWFNAREPQAQTFVKDGDRFTVVANHFKSKSPGAPTGDNVDTGDGQGQWNGDRRRQAASLADFVDGLRASTGDDDVLMLGDFNSYSQEDPVVDLLDRGFADLGADLDAGRYSYVFDQLSGSLDHAFGTDAVTAKVTDVAHWNINSVESFAYQYDGDPALYAPHQYRSSDHDPLVLGLDLEERCHGLLPTITGTTGPNTLVGTSGNDVIMGLGGDDHISGVNGQDVVCGGAGDDVVDGGNGDDVLLGGFGTDRLLGANGDDGLVGGPGTDLLDGGRGSNSLEQEGPES